jgi:hypothetical protein
MKGLDEIECGGGEFVEGKINFIDNDVSNITLEVLRTCGVIKKKNMNSTIR